MLVVRNLAAGYGPVQVLFDVSLNIAASEVLALLGRNGMGKTTIVRAILGLLPTLTGRIECDGVSITDTPPYRIARRGIGLVPEGRQIFPTLTVAENLRATARPGLWTIERILTLFPRLAERSAQWASSLSGGEQQMLAIGRALMTNPRLLILDEATEGLAPLIRAEIWAVLARLKQEGMAILVIDKNLDAMLRLADRHVIIQKGQTVWTGPGAKLTQEIRDAHLHV
jgi:branched-chain amino acid transport system ATP-binding protein